jgi:hypothetical protein
MLAHSPQSVPTGQPKRRHAVTANVLAANRRNFEKAHPVSKEIRYLPMPKRTAAGWQNCTCAGQLVRRSARLSASAKKAGAVVAHLAFATTWVLFNREELDSPNHASAAHLAKHSRRITAEPVSDIAHSPTEEVPREGQKSKKRFL